VAFLTITTLLDHGHDEVLSGHEGQLRVDAALNDLGVHNETRDNVEHGRQNNVSGQESRGDRNTANSTVIKSSLKPLNRGSGSGVLEKRLQVTRKRANTLTSHGVSLVSHGRRTNLGLLKGLLNLLEVSKQTDISSKLVSRDTKGSQGAQNVNVNLSRVGLASARVSVVKAQKLNNTGIKLLNLVVVAVEKGKEGALSTGGTLDTSKTQIVSGTLEVSQIPEQLLDPESGTLTNGGQLCGLEMSPAKNGEVLVLNSKLGKSVDDIDKLGDQEVKTVSQEDKISIVGDKARGSTKVDNTGSGRSRLTVDVDVGHDIVSNNGLLLSGSINLLVSDLDVSLELLNGFVGDSSNAELLLSDSKVVPELSPGGVSGFQGEKLRHLLGGISGGQRSEVLIVNGHGGNAERERKLMVVIEEEEEEGNNLLLYVTD